MAIKTVVIGYQPKTKKMAQRIEETANEMEAQGYQFITCSVTPSARAILIFREAGERKSSPAAPITERDL